MTINITPNNMGHLTMKALYKFADSCDFSSKESYLKWVAEYKALLFLMEPTIRRMKQLRSPYAVKASTEFHIYQDPEYNGTAIVHDNSAYEAYACKMQSDAATSGNFMTYLYAKRIENKVKSWAQKQLAKETV